MAEAVFSSLINSTSPSSKDPTLVSDSAGTAAYHEGDPPDPRTLRVLKQNGITRYMHEARKVREEDFWRFDWILGMDNDNVEDLLFLRKKVLAKKMRKGNPRREEDGSNGEDGDERGRAAEVRLFGDFGGGKGEEVVDPYYGGGEGFGIAFEQMGRFGRGFLKFLREGRGKVMITEGGDTT
ncbi:MAG: hypothetical protein M1835_003699 [Candelina submexicana]|nr:MAG: hypothetical protein M1835_003699 [Candelina submexicana]